MAAFLRNRGLDAAAAAMEAACNAGAVPHLPSIEHEINVLNPTEQAVVWRRIFGPTSPREADLAAPEDVGPVDLPDSPAAFNELVAKFWNFDRITRFTDPSLGRPFED